MKILVDANVFLDVFRRRRGWQGSLAVLSLIRAGQVEGCITASTSLILYFHRVRSVGEAQARQDALPDGFAIIPLTEAILRAAVAHSCPQFEDNILIASALEVKADHIITRNKRDFQQTQVSVLTPEEFLALWKQQKPMSRGP